MKIKKIISLLIILLINLACSENEQADKAEHDKIIDRDLNDIKKDGRLKVLTTYSATSYFIYRGKPMGFEYELLKRVADHLDLKLDLKVSNDLDNLLKELNNGDVDLVAHGITVTSDRKEKVAFTDYLYLTNQVLVQKKPDNWRKLHWSKIDKSLKHDAIELIGDTISVRKNSSYYSRLQNLMKEIGGEIFIDTISGEISTDEIIKKVVDGEIKYTVADNNIASINASYYPILDIEVPISFSQRIAWAVRSNSDSLLGAINKWLKDIKKTDDYYVIYNKYFKNKRSFRRRVRSEFFSLNEGRISKYDNIIKSNAKKINMDWRLLASQIYQESRFEPNANSWAGANGLMQIMPETAKEIGINDPTDPNQSIKGGMYYLKQMWDNFDDIQDSTQRMKFALASYNCGYYHVLDAQKLAEKRNFKINVWDENVEFMLLELSYPQNYNDEVVEYGYVRGIEPYTYVRQIFERYQHYKKFIEN